MKASDAFLASSKRRIETTLLRFFSSQEKKAVHPLSRSLMHAVGEFTSRRGAKRARGILVLLGYLSNSKNKVTSDILKVAAAYEILHAYLLIHDDLIDRDVERRGRPTLHKIFETYAPHILKKQQREQIGIDIAIIVGDLAADLAQRMVLDTRFSDAQKLDVLEYFEQTLHTTYVGQVIDILALPDRLPSFSDQRLRYLLKTATYTIEAPFMAGARLGKARINRKALHAFAQNAGLAFQLSNDVQNVFESGIAGRSSDIREGKITLLVSYALQSRKYRKELLRLLKKQGKTRKDVLRLRRLIELSGGYAKAWSEVVRLHDCAEKSLEKVGVPDMVRAQFDYLLKMLKKLDV